MQLKCAWSQEHDVWSMHVQDARVGFDPLHLTVHVRGTAGSNFNGSDQTNEKARIDPLQLAKKQHHFHLEWKALVMQGLWSHFQAPWAVTFPVSVEVGTAFCWSRQHACHYQQGQPAWLSATLQPVSPHPLSFSSQVWTCGFYLITSAKLNYFQSRLMRFT